MLTFSQFAEASVPPRKRPRCHICGEPGFGFYWKNTYHWCDECGEYTCDNCIEYEFGGWKYPDKAICKLCSKNVVKRKPEIGDVADNAGRYHKLRDEPHTIYKPDIVPAFTASQNASRIQGKLDRLGVESFNAFLERRQKVEYYAR